MSLRRGPRPDRPAVQAHLRRAGAVLGRPRWASSRCLRPLRSAWGPTLITRPRVDYEPPDGAAGSLRTSDPPRVGRCVTRCSPGGAFRQPSILLSEVFHRVGPVAHWTEEGACRCRHGRRPAGVSRGVTRWLGALEKERDEGCARSPCLLAPSAQWYGNHRAQGDCQDVLMAVDPKIRFAAAGVRRCLVDAPALLALAPRA